MTTAHTSLSEKFCIFVDGLDEFDPPVGDGASSCPDIKLCFSTRPWTFAMKDLDQSEQVVNMEKLTKKYIKEYAEKRLGSDEDSKDSIRTDERFNVLCSRLLRNLKAYFSGLSWLSGD